MSTTYRRPPKGYRMLRAGEIRMATDIRYSFLYDSGSFDLSWGPLDSYDKTLIGTVHSGNEGGCIPLARRIRKRKKK